MLNIQTVKNTVVCILLKAFCIICCFIFLLGYFYFCAQTMFGNFSLRQFIFHVAAIPTMDFSASLVAFVLLPLIIGGLLMLFALKNPETWLRFYVSEKLKDYLGKSKFLISFISSAITGLMGVLLLTSASEYTVSQIFQQAQYVGKLWNGQQNYDTIIDENYAEPQQLRWSLDKPHNLIIVFAESMEKTFEDAAVFEENLLPRLQNQKGSSFSGQHELSETNWTHASMVATLCGITSKLYLPPRKISDNLTCISDILNQYNYNLYALQGTSPQFAGTKDFLKAHKFTEVEGIHELSHVSDVQTYNLNFIGRVIEDDALFERFKSKIEFLAQQSQPFMALVFTMDTHPFHGHLSRQCPEKYHDMRDAILCADTTLSRFVEWFKQQNMQQNTTLIIMGDHLMMYNDMQNRLALAAHRQTLNLMWGYAAPDHDIFKPFNQFDWAPTLLEMAGFQWNGNRFALGTSLLSNTKTLQETFGDTLNRRLLNNSKLYEEKCIQK